jgi:hypothetical protein
MSVTSVQIAEKDRYLEQIEKIIHSHTLRKAESLCKLLRYLAHHALTQPGIPVKEYQIATEVFGRPNDFNPQADSAIRVQAGRLRLKLIDYYSHEGLSDPIVVEMPNGFYAIQFHVRALSLVLPGPVALPAPSAAPSTSNAPTPGERRASSRRRPGLIPALVTLSVMLIAALAAVTALAIALSSSRAKAKEMPAVPAAVRSFWSRFGSTEEVPYVIFSNAAFVGRPETGMRYRDPSRDSRDLILDHYTGVGEVLAVHELDKVFSALKYPIEVKRGSLFTLDDAKKNDLIFVGSPAENLSPLDLPGSQEFVFRRLTSSPHKGDLGIVNVHPEPGQAAIFYPSESTQPLTEDYAIVALGHGLNPDRSVLILAGTTTIGTQAAVEYVCAKDSLEELLRKLEIQPGSEVKTFEALLRVKVTRGVPVETDLVAVRNRK